MLPAGPPFKSSVAIMIVRMFVQSKDPSDRTSHCDFSFVEVVNRWAHISAAVSAFLSRFAMHQAPSRQ